MKRVKRKEMLGLLLILGACFIIILNHGFKTTGAVIGLLFSSVSYSDFIALIMLVIGILFHIHGGDSLEKNLAADILKSGKMIDKPKEIERIAKKMGYEEREVKEGCQIIYNGHPLTVIPRHHISPGVYKSIMKALSTGESSFRRYSHV